VRRDARRGGLLPLVEQRRGAALHASGPARLSRGGLAFLARIALQVVMRRNICVPLLALAVSLASGLSAKAATDPLVGTWVPQGVDAQILAREAKSLRVLVVEQGPGDRLTGNLLVPTVFGMPVAISRDGERVGLTLQMARGMETPLEARLAGDRLEILQPGNPPAVLQRATKPELEVLERIAPKKLPLPAMKVLPDNGLAKTPPMGFSTWNHFATKIDDKTIREIADALVSTGLRDAGYVHVNIDDGWQGTRNAQGEIQPNEKFPDMKGLAAYLHARGLKLGIYTSPGPTSCAGFIGSYGHEEQDARTFASWDVDYVKHDWCSAGLIYDDDEMPAVYLKMAEALRATGRPMVYSICQYGRADVWTWAPGVGGNLWRTTGDIADRWPIMAAIGFAQDELSPYSRPGHWNDPDMLEVGNGGMTTTEYRTHMSLWAMLAAPLIAGHDVRRSSPETIALLTNREVIAIDQDPLGRAGKRVLQRGSQEVWARPLEGGRTAVALFNRGEEPATIEATLAELGVARGASARDVWRGRAFDVRDEKISAEVEPHGVLLLVLAPAGAATPPAASPAATSTAAP
jgi:alpha-galactosidase